MKKKVLDVNYHIFSTYHFVEGLSYSTQHRKRRRQCVRDNNNHNNKAGNKTRPVSADV